MSTEPHWLDYSEEEVAQFRRQVEEDHAKPERWIALNGCRESFHYFLRDEAGEWQGWHGDDSVCEVVEFSLKTEGV